MITDAFSHDNNTLKWINYKKNVTNIFANEWEIHWWYISLLKNGGRPLARSSKLTYSSVDSYLIHFKIFVCQVKTTFKADLMSDCMFLSCHVCVSQWAHSIVALICQGRDSSLEAGLKSGV